MLRHSNLPDAERNATERETRAEQAIRRRPDDQPDVKHVLRVRPSFVRLPRTEPRRV